jgi:peptide-methionine (S)-S-oxide reductase
MRIVILASMAIFAAAGAGCGEKPSPRDVSQPKEATPTMAAKPEPGAPAPKPPGRVETATLGAGCFWCVEAVYQELKGVISVESGYSGGPGENPTYREVCSGKTGHAEVCQIKFDPAVLGFKDVLEVFWKTHDPTTLNRQGNDKGTQYRSVVFTHSDEQKALAEKYKMELEASGAWDKPLVTEITPFTKFWKAEDYHQNYFRDNPQQGYCAFIIAPKMEKFRKVFGEKLNR